MSEDPTRKLPNDATILQQILDELRLLNRRVQALEEKSDARSRETQPMTERIDQLIAEVAATRNELRTETAAIREELRSEIAAVRRELREDRLATHRAMRMVDRTLQGMIADLALALDADDDLHQRVTKLEERLEPAK